MITKYIIDKADHYLSDKQCINNSLNSVLNLLKITLKQNKL